MRIIYMGTPDFAVPPLRRLHQEGHELIAAVTQPDKPKGRHGELSMSDVKKAALELSVPVLQPIKASDPDFIESIRELRPDAIVVAAYGQILKKELLDIPPMGCINIHASLLPRWRGASPVAASIMAGDEYTGVSTMLMDAGVDTGDILLQERTAIGPEDTAGSLTDRLSEMGAELLIRTLEGLEEGKLKPTKQESTGIAFTYAGIMKKEQGDLDFSLSSEAAERQIRGLSPWPGAYTHIGGKLFKIHRAEALTDTDKKAGDILAAYGEKGLEPGRICILEDQLFIRCREGFLRLLEVQLEGKKRMSSEEFLRGSRELLEKAGGCERISGGSDR